jgi:signal transduction histidine kinase
LSLQKRLTAFTLVVVIIVAGSAGLFLIQIGFRDQLSRVFSELKSIEDTVIASEVDKATVALALVSASQAKISLYVADENNDIYPLFDRAEDTEQLDIAKQTITNNTDLESNFIISRIVEIEGDLKLVLTTSLSSIYEERSSEAIRFLIYLLLATLGALLVLQKVIARDVARESRELILREKLSNEESRRKLLLEFASDASHELRTPLTVITGYLDLIKKRDGLNIEPGTLERISKEAFRLDRNISSLLTMLELEVMEDVSLVSLNISELIKAEVLSFKEIEPARKVVFEIDTDLWVRGSEELVLKLLRNILGNIRRHSSLDSSVKVKLRRIDESAEISIEDGGPLSYGQSLKIEDYLTQFSSSRSMSKGGSGLGFSIMSKSVSKLQGQISLFHSDLGGLGVLIKIPLIQATEI